jgi:GAF domain-containing protein
MSTTLAAELERLAEMLAAHESGAPEISMTTIAEKIAKSLGVEPDEVAILALAQKSRQLHFLFPEKLTKVGAVPLSSTTSLAARTMREGRAEVVNNFTTVRHAYVFEGVRIEGRSTADMIQKIISAPIQAGDKAVGVIQVSRKGPNIRKAGPDFTQADVNKVMALSVALGKLIQHFPV